jgi:hypothetical protein
VTKLADGRYRIRLLTDWHTSILLRTWTLGGASLRTGRVGASATFDGHYDLRF